MNCRPGLLLGLLLINPSFAQDAVKVYSAGSLREGLTAAARAFEAGGGPKVDFTFGASGLLRGRLAGPETADVFASANTEHAQALVAAGRAIDARPFAGNRMCALAQSSVRATPETLLQLLLDPATRLATSTPKADPSGDYAWLMFEKAEHLRPGAFALLSGKAIQLVGGANSPAPPPGRTAYGHWIEQKAADVFLSYCTNAVLAAREVPGLKVIDMPASLAVEARYGVALMREARAGGRAFRDYMFSPAGQSILVLHGFSRVQP